MWRRIWTISLAVWLTLGVINTGAETDRLAEIRTLTGQQEFAQAMRRLDQFLSDNPKNLDAKLLRGVILTRQGDLDAAITAFEQLSLEHPTLAEPHNNLAVLHASRRDYEKARVALLRAIELQPRYDTAHENLGDIYAKLAEDMLGDRETARGGRCKNRQPMVRRTRRADEIHLPRGRHAGWLPGLPSTVRKYRRRRCADYQDAHRRGGGHHPHQRG